MYLEIYWCIICVDSPFVIVIDSVHWVIRHHLGRLIPDLTRD